MGPYRSGRPDRSGQGRDHVTMTTDRSGSPGGPVAGESAHGGPPEPHPLLARLDSPLATYYLLLGAIGALLGIGLIMVLSASSVTSYQKSGSLFGTGLNQAKFAVLGVIVAVIASRMPTSLWRRLATPSLILALMLQLLVFTPLGLSDKGNRNWLALGSTLTLQPSEFGKLAIILYGAHILAVKRRLLGDWRHAVVPVVVPAGLGIIGLVMLGNDLGTCMVLIGILFSVLWTSGISAKLFGVSAVIGGLGVLVLTLTSSNRMSRIASMRGCGDDPSAHGGLCWQSVHGQWALAQGGLGGVGLGQSREKWGWLPEQHNDYIFAIIGEELGIWGTFTILLLVAMITFACYRVILHTDDMFVRMATAGVMGWFVVQSVVNIGAVVGLLPVIGVPLPLVSAGGSALVTTLLGLGMVVSFARSEPACRRALAERPRVLARSLSIMSPTRKRSR